MRPLRGDSTRIGLVLGTACLVAHPAFAQVDAVSTPPPNLVLDNYNSVPVGPYGGLEGSAYIARVGDPSAAWFNPAGLARQSTAQISGSAGVYQSTSVTPTSLPNRGGSFQQLPNFVGFSFAPSSRLTVGAALVTTNAWNQETDSQLITTVAAGQQRFAYSADSDFEQRVLALRRRLPRHRAVARRRRTRVFAHEPSTGPERERSARRQHRSEDAARDVADVRNDGPASRAGWRAVRHVTVAIRRSRPHARLEAVPYRRVDARRHARRRRRLAGGVGLRCGRHV